QAGLAVARRGRAGEGAVSQRPGREPSLRRPESRSHRDGPAHAASPGALRRLLPAQEPGGSLARAAEALRRRPRGRPCPRGRDPMRPLRLEIEGFPSFRDRVVLDLADLDLFAITGPTGAGKSSLIDAMVFPLYGQVPRVGNEYRQLLS